MFTKDLLQNKFIYDLLVKIMVYTRPTQIAPH